MGVGWRRRRGQCTRWLQPCWAHAPPTPFLPHQYNLVSTDKSPSDCDLEFTWFCWIFTNLWTEISLHVQVQTLIKGFSLILLTPFNSHYILTVVVRNHPTPRWKKRVMHFLVTFVFHYKLISVSFFYPNVSPIFFFLKIINVPKSYNKK